VSRPTRAAAACLLACGLAVSILAPAASLADLPKRKPGLWEMSAIPANDKQSEVSGRVCIDAETDAYLTNFAMGVTSQICSKRDIQIKGNVATIDAVCKIGDSLQTSHSKITFTGNTAYRAEVTVHSDPPFMGIRDSKAGQVGKWSGPCPADMKPGDLITGKGLRINLKDMAVFRQ
jgi:hypothetical protein